MGCGVRAGVCGGYRAPELAAATVSLKDLQAARNQRRRELRQQLTARRSLVDLLTHPAEPPAATATTPGKAVGTPSMGDRPARVRFRPVRV